MRDNFTPVPGCDGTGRRSKDYCITDTSSDSGPNPTPNPTPAVSSLFLCFDHALAIIMQVSCLQRYLPFLTHHITCYIFAIQPTACKPEPPVVKHAINSGGSGYTSAGSGIAYDADRDFSGGDTFSANGDIGGTAEDTLYVTERNAGLDQSFSYNLPVTVGKSYRITIKLAEIWHKVDNVNKQRVFDVLVEGQTVFNDVDIYDLVGPRAALDLEHTYVAKDGTLDIKFQNFLQKAKVSAILVEELSSCSPTPGPDPDDSVSTHLVIYSCLTKETLLW